jgi:methyltransferase
MVIRIAFTALVALVAAQRLWEVRRSRRHERALRRAGAVEHARGQMPWMKALHGAWLLAGLAEVWLLDRAPWLPLSILALVAFVGGQALRLAAMRALGERWTVRVLVLPGQPPVTGGIFRYLRHPNYLGVAIEVAALPLVGGAWITAVVFSLANALLLFCRVVAEERALKSASDYAARFADRPRFVPRGASE